MLAGNGGRGSLATTSSARTLPIASVKDTVSISIIPTLLTLSTKL